MKKQLSDLTSQVKSIEKRLNYFPTLLKEHDNKYSDFIKKT